VVKIETLLNKRPVSKLNLGVRVAEAVLSIKSDLILNKNRDQIELNFEE